MSTLEHKEIAELRRPIWALAMKRFMDVAISAVMLAVLSPLLLAVMLAVLLIDGWPVFYCWRVVGENGRPFVGYKFRTMIRDADGIREDLSHHNEMVGPVFKIRRDPRVTRLGRVLRQTSFDELPQLVSVLRGQMSLVGPRPPLVSEYERFTPFQRRKLAVKPGVTCLWQVSGRNEISNFDEWVRLDLDYIEHWSLWLDLKILALTVKAVLTGRGAA